MVMAGNANNTIGARPKWRFQRANWLVLAIVAIPVAYFGGTYCLRTWRIDKSLAALKPIEAWGAAQDKNNIAQSVAAIDAFFAHAEKDGVPAFSADALGFWHNAVYSAEDHMFWSDGKNCADYQAEVFRQDLFSGQELKLAVRSAVSGYFQRGKAIENRMLLRIEQDIPASNGRPQNHSTMATGMLKNIYLATTTQSQRADSPAIRHGIEEGVASNVVTLLAMDIGSDVAVAGAGAGAAALGIGALGSWETAGISVAAGAAVAAGIYGIDKLYGVGDKQKAKVEALTRQLLEKMRLETINGITGRPGLLEALEGQDRSWKRAYFGALKKTVISYEENNHE